MFKTKCCGWGVRSTLAIERGRVLGIYTGYVIELCTLFLTRFAQYLNQETYVRETSSGLIFYCPQSFNFLGRRRTDAELKPENERGYLFDLDSRETPEQEDIEDRYSVDSSAYGNWTRFIK